MPRLQAQGSIWVKVTLILTIWSFGFAISPDRCRVWAADMELLTPKPGATIIARNPETHLVLRQSGTGEAIRVRLKKTGAMLKPVEAIKGGEHIYLHFRLPLKRGQNIFTIVPGGQQLELTYQPLQAILPTNMKKFYLFHQNSGQLPESCVGCHDLTATETIYPVGLEQQTSCAACHKNLIERYPQKHSTTVNQQCLSCHLQYSNSKPWRIGFRQGKIDETCYTCHTSKKVWQSRKYPHGPMIGGCTLCHNPHGSKYPNQLLAEGSLDLCISCHVDKQNLVDKKDPVPYVHGIIFGKGCIACHNPHATDEKFMLIKPINKLCISCHPGVAAAGLTHPVAGHPVAGPRNPSQQNRKFSCTSCHDPHGSVHQNMLIETKLGGRLCRVCHKR